jgi:hypothetical protein
VYGPRNVRPSVAIPCVLALGVLAVAAHADVAPPPPPPPPRLGIHLTYTLKPGAERCPARRAMEYILIGQYAYDPFDFTHAQVDAAIEIIISRDGGRYHAEYTIGRPDGEFLWVEELTRPRCNDLLLDLALYISIHTSTVFPAPPAPEPPAPEPPAPEPPPPLPAPPPPVAARPRRLPARPAQAPPRLWAIGLAPEVGFGQLPGVALGGSASLVRRWEAMSLGVELRYLRSAGYAVQEGYSLAGSELDLGAVPCRVQSRLNLCLPVYFGGRMLDAANAPRRSGPFWDVAFQARIGVRFDIGAGVLLEPFGGVGLQVQSNPYKASERGPFQARSLVEPEVLPTASLGLRLSLPL